MKVAIDTSSLKHYDLFLRIKSLPRYSFAGGFADVPDEYAASLGLAKPTATSIAAARVTDRSGRGENIRMKVLKLCNAPHWRERGITQEEICELLDIQTSTCNPRVNELACKLGYLRIIGVRKISTGRNAQVYQITPAGRERLGNVERSGQ